MVLRRPRSIRRYLSVHCCRLLIAALGVSSVAFAESPDASTAGSARVEQLMNRGIQSRELGRDAEALEFYRQAVALEPENPRVLAHLGATYLALGRWVSAHTYLLRALEYRKDSYIERHAKELEDALSTAADHVGFLEVYGAPNGAEALLNGQLVASLPMSAPIPVTVGSYVLEVRFKDHYTLGRPISVSPRGLTREEVALSPHRGLSSGVGSSSAASLGGASAPTVGDGAATANEARPERQSPTLEDAGGANPWPWIFGGLSAAAAITSAVAWERREHHAERWNDDDACLGPGVSRQERCGSELDKGQRAETVLWVSGAAAGVFATSAVLSAVLWPSKETDSESALRCAPGAGGAACFGTF